MKRDTNPLNRREALQRLSALGIGAVVSACGNGGSDPAATPTATVAASPTVLPPSATPFAPATATRTSPPTSTATRSATATATPSPTATVTPDDIACVLSPAETLGPFFIDVGLARSDIREDRSGVELRLTLQFVDGDGCAPIRDAVVNIWHADAGGAYSGFANQPGGVDTTGATFLRGFQITDAGGQVEFTTIYPGWYPGRTPHIHVRVHLDSTTVLATQLYFPEPVTNAVYAVAPYNTRPPRDTTNATDAIGRGHLDTLRLTVTAENDGYTGTIVFGVA